MGNSAADDCRRHKDRHTEHIKPAVAGKERPQRPERCIGETHDKTPHRADRRDAIKLQQVDFRRGDWCGLCGCGQRDRHQRQRCQHRHQRKERERSRARQIEHQLAERDRRKIDDQIDREQLPACFIRGAFVEPAFDHHIKTGKSKAVQRAQDRPDIRVHHQLVHQRQHRGDTGQRRKAADMTRALHHIGPQHAAQQKAEEVHTANDADGRCGKPLKAGAQRNERSEQTVTDQ